MDITDGRRTLRAGKYSCVVLSSKRVLTAPRCGWPVEILMLVGSTICMHMRKRGLSTGKTQLCVQQFVCSSQAKTDVKTSSNASTQYPK